MTYNHDNGTVPCPICGQIGYHTHAEAGSYEGVADLIRKVLATQDGERAPSRNFGSPPAEIAAGMDHAIAAMDRAFGVGVAEAHELLRTNAGAKRVYDCALLALSPAGRDVEAAVEAGAKAFHDAMREKRFLRWETSSEEYRKEIRDLVRPAIVAALASV